MRVGYVLPTGATVRQSLLRAIGVTRGQPPRPDILSRHGARALRARAGLIAPSERTDLNDQGCTQAPSCRPGFLCSSRGEPGA